MKYTIISDLHIHSKKEFEKFQTWIQERKHNEVVILNGDIFEAQAIKKDMLPAIKNCIKHCVVIEGNHDSAKWYASIGIHAKKSCKIKTPSGIYFIEHGDAHTKRHNKNSRPMVKKATRAVEKKLGTFVLRPFATPWQRTFRKKSLAICLKEEVDKVIFGHTHLFEHNKHFISGGFKRRTFYYLEIFDEVRPIPYAL
jgi:predicted phosphodiesterase